MIELGPAAQRVAEVLSNLDDTDLGRPTPCPDATVGQLVDHIGRLALAFTASAKKERDTTTGPPPALNADNLEPGWRDGIAGDLDGLAVAWRDPAAWDGLTSAGGIELPGNVAGLVALDEVLVHGWDVAVATGQAYGATDDEISAAMGFVQSFEAPRDGALFGPVVPVPEDAPPLDRLLGLTGRDPRWRPAG